MVPPNIGKLKSIQQLQVISRQYLKASVPHCLMRDRYRQFVSNTSFCRRSEHGRSRRVHSQGQRDTVTHRLFAAQGSVLMRRGA